MKISKIKTSVYSFTLMMIMAVTAASAGRRKQEFAQMWTTAEPRTLNGKMVTLSSNSGAEGAEVAFYPPYYSFRQNNAWDELSGAYPTRAYRSWDYRKRAYPTGAYRSWDYRNRAHPTGAYRSWDYRNRAYPTGSYRSWDYRNRAYPTGSYRSRDYENRVYPTRPDPTRGYHPWADQSWAYLSWAKPTRAFRAYRTRAYRPWAQPTGASWAYRTRAAQPTRAYPTQDDTTWSKATNSYPTTSYPSWTTEAPTRGVSVCLRYVLDVETSSRGIFTLSPSSSAPLTLGLDYDGSYLLAWSSTYWSLKLKDNLRVWPGIRDDLWTRLCLTVDTVRGVAQIFSGANMSVRKMVPSKYVWSGEPVITMSGMDGQVTDLQMWDYPLPYTAILDYMARSSYGWSRGSVLTWSNIGYSLKGRTLVEDVYEQRRAAESPKKKKPTRVNKNEARKKTSFE